MKNTIKCCLFSLIVLVIFAFFPFTRYLKASNECSVYYLNYRPEVDEQWQRLAKKYTELTGVKVKVVTAASNNYETTFLSELDKKDCPTLFETDSERSIINYSDIAYDLRNTKFYDELTDTRTCVEINGEIKAIGYSSDILGIAVNTALLSKAGYSVSDINSYSTLKKVAEDITSRKNELDFGAFSVSGLDSSSFWRITTHLGNTPLYLEFNENVKDTEKFTYTHIQGSHLNVYKKLFDLYINNSTCSPDMLSTKTATDSYNEFINEKVVFYQTGSWDYSKIRDSGFDTANLDIIPIYHTEDNTSQGLCEITGSYWMVNKNASKKNIDATLDFLYWCANSEEGTSLIASDMGFLTPFKNSKNPDNKFLVKNIQNKKEGISSTYAVISYIPSEIWKSKLASELVKYAANPNSDNWENVTNAFIKNWNDEYKLLGSEE